MKKVKKIIKNNVKVLIAFILGGIILGTGGVYAATVINASDVSYKNASSGMTSTNVQGAIEELYNDSKKNLDFIDETVGTDFAHDVFASYYSDPCLKGNKCSYFDMTGGDIIGSCVNSYINSCRSNCMNSCTDDNTICNDKCNGICTASTNTTAYASQCISGICGKSSDMVKFDNGCSEKCSNNDTCYKSCFHKAVGNTTCADYYLTDKSNS